MAESTEQGVLAQLAIFLNLKVDKKGKEEANELVESLKEGLEYFAGYEAVKGLFELVEHTVEAAGAAKALSERLNITIESVQELGYAADLSNASAEDMRISLQHLALAMEQAGKTGTGPLLDALQKLHVPFQNIKGEKLDQNLEEIAEAFKAAPEGVNKTALAMEIFGQKGARLIPLLNKGKEGIKELRSEFVGLGGEIHGEDAEALDKFEEQQKKIKYMWDGIKTQAVMALLPGLMKLVEAFKEWIAANRELIASSIVDLISALTTAMKGLGFVAGIAAKAFEFISRDHDAVVAGLMAIGAAIAFVAAESLIAWASNPFGWIILALGAIIYAVIKIVENFDWLVEQIKAFLVKYRAVLTLVGLAGWLIVGGMAGPIALILGLVGELIEHWTEFKEFFVNLGESIKKVWDDLWNYLDNKWQAFKSDHPWIAKGIEFAANAPSNLLAAAHGDLSGFQNSFTDLGNFGMQQLGMPQLSSGSAGSGSSNQTASINIEQHIHPTPGMSEEDIGNISAEKTKEVLKDWVRDEHANSGLTG